MEVNNFSLETILCNIRLSNPVMLGSGPVGDSTARLLECLEYGAGAVVNKTIHWQQNLDKVMVSPRYFYGNGYMLNCERGNELSWQAWKSYGIAEVMQGGALLVSLAGTDINGAVRLAQELTECQPAMYEVNVSCPHSERKKNIHRDYVMELVQALKEVIGNIPMVVKLGYANDLIELAQAAQTAGANAICTTNSIGPGLAVDIRTGKPRLGILGGSGGVSGPAIKPIALHCVAIVSQAVSIPVVGCGGVRNADDVIEMMMAGATAVQLYTEVHLHGPQVFNQITNDLLAYMREMGLHSLSEVVGAVHPYLHKEHSSRRSLLTRHWKGFQRIETGIPPAERGDKHSDILRPYMVVVGDANLDILLDLRNTDLSVFGKSDINVINGTKDLRTGIQTRAGGGGVLFATAAQAAGFDTCLIYKLGCGTDGQPDLAGQVILRYLLQSGAKSLYTKQLSGYSGKILILSLAGDRRMMVSDRGANSQFNIHDINQEMRDAAARADIFHISGYCFLVPEQRMAVQSMAWHAREHNALVSLDVVPHHLYRFFSFQDFLEATRAVDILTIELATALRFLGTHINEAPNWPINSAHPVISELLRYYSCLILRLNNNMQVIATNKSLTIEETGYANTADRTGYLDKLLAKNLFTFILNQQNGPGDN